MQSHDEIALAIAQTKLALAEMHEALGHALIMAPHAFACPATDEDAHPDVCRCWHANVYDVYRRWL